MTSSNHLGADNADFVSFLGHGHAYALELEDALQQCQRQRRIAVAATAHEATVDAGWQLGSLAAAATETNRFVGSVCRQLSTGPQLSPFRLWLLGSIWPWSSAQTNDGTHDRADVGDGLAWEHRDAFEGHPQKGVAAGQSIVQRGLSDMADGEQIATDEFEAVIHDNGKVTLVLPGVIDLSEPHLGYDPVSRSSRDLDQVAIWSAMSSDLNDNAYAIMIAAFVANGIDSGLINQGADVLIIGHSFGAETAFDLAASEEFNGGLVKVTHVVAAGYHNEPQIDDVMGGTQVAVLQNIYDVPVLVEGIALDLLRWPSPDKHEASKNSRRGDGFSSLGRIAVEAFELAASQAVDGTTFSIIGDNVERLDGRGLIAEFEGGMDRFGHHPDHYANYLSRPNSDPAVTAFVASIGEQGYGRPGNVVTVDVSLPSAD